MIELPRPFNLDASDLLFSLADCLHMGETIVNLQTTQSKTRAHIDAVVATNGVYGPLIASYWNPLFEFFTGTDTPYLRNLASYACTDYLAKRFRFVREANVTCSEHGARVSIDVVGGSLGSIGQTYKYVPTNDADTSVSVTL